MQIYQAEAWRERREKRAARTFLVLCVILVPSMMWAIKTLAAVLR